MGNNIAQNRRILRKIKDYFFGVYRTRSTYQNLLFALLLFPISIILFVYMVSIYSITVSLMIVMVGFPLNYWFLRSLPYPIKFVALLSKTITGLPEREIEIKMNRKLQGNFLHIYRDVIFDRMTFSSFIYLMFIFPVTLLLFIISVVFLSIALLLRIDPLYMFIFHKDLNQSITLSYFGLPQWLDRYETMILSLLGYIVMSVQLNFINKFVQSHARVIEKLLDEDIPLEGDL